MPTTPPWPWTAAIVSSAGMPGGTASPRNSATRSPSSDLISSPTMTVTSEATSAAIARASMAPSIRSWSVIARWVRPRWADVLSRPAGEASESNDERECVWRSAKYRFAGAVTGSSDLGDQRLLEEVEVLQRQARAEGDAVQRVLGDVARHPGHLGEQPIDVAEQGAAPGHHHPLVDDVRAELGRRLLENRPHGRNELLERRFDRLHHLGRRDRDRPRQARDEVTAPDLHLE